MSQPHPLTRWRDAAVLLSLTTALAAQRIRFEAFETEKSGLLMLLAALIAGTSVKRPRFRHPIIMTAFGLLIWALFSTAFALTPVMSLWGEPYRGQGWLTLLAGVILMWGAANLSSAALSAIKPLLCLIAIPMCLLAGVSRFGLDAALPQLERPAALAGNVNFLTDWLAMILILIFPLLFEQGRLRLLGFGTALLILATLLMSEGRAAFLSLLAAGIFGLLVWGYLQKQRRWLWFVLFIIGFAGAVYLIGGQTGARLFRLDDPSRVAMWNDGMMLISNMTTPFQDAYNRPDQSAALRPLVGYGFDNLEQTHPRLIETPRYFSSWIDRFHNQFLDSVLSIGWPGLVLQVSLYGAALITGLRAMGLLLDVRAVIGWMMWSAAGGVIGLSIAATYAPIGLRPVAIGLGMFIGLCGWLAWKTLQVHRVVSQTTISFTPDRLLTISLLMVVAQQWIANQFGFTQTIGQTIWWMILGLLVRQSEQAETPLIPTEEVIKKWRGLAFIPALFLIHSLGTFPVGVQFTSWSTLLILGAISVSLGSWIWGIRRQDLWMLLVFGFVIFGIRVGSAWLIQQGIKLQGGIHLMLGTGSLSLSGLLVISVGMIWLVRQESENQANVNRRRWGVIIACALLGAALYVIPYTGASLHKIGDQASGHRQYGAASQSLNLALVYSPVNSRVYLSRAHMQLARPELSRAESARMELERLFEAAPFMTNTRDIYDLRRVLGE